MNLSENTTHNGNQDSHSNSQDSEDNNDEQDQQELSEVEKHEIDPTNSYNILLLGQSGVGKSTFTNAMANYLRYGSWNEAFKKPKILIDTSFTTMSEDFKPIKIEMKRNVKTTDGEHKHLNNEDHNEKGQSCTQEPIIHEMIWKDGNSIKLLRVIDTPGVCDTRGDNQDEENLRKIFQVIETIGEINAISILLKPNVSSLTLDFRNTLDKILVKLHSNVKDNIIFCFTNTRSTLYRPGETVPTLKAYFEDLKRRSGVIITLNRFNMFCFENESFRHLCSALQDPNNQQGSLHKTIIDGWSKNVEELKRMLERIQGIVPCKRDDVVVIDKVNQLVVNNSDRFIDIELKLLKKLECNEADIKNLQNKLERLDHQLENIAMHSSNSRISNSQTPLLNRRIMVNERDRESNWDQKIKSFIKLTLRVVFIPFWLIYNGIRKLNLWMNIYELHDQPRTNKEMPTQHNVDMENREHEDDNMNKKNLERNHDQLSQKKKEIEDMQTVLQNCLSLLAEIFAESAALLRHNSLIGCANPYLESLNNRYKKVQDQVKYDKEKNIEKKHLETLITNHEKGMLLILDQIKNGQRTTLPYEEINAKVISIEKMIEDRYYGEL